MSAPSRNDTTASRDRLLSAAIDHVTEHGVGDLRLRELAESIGTSHRMLIYHFGSKEGLMVAIVQTVEAAERDFLARLIQDRSIEPVDAIAAMWRRFADPAGWPQERLFFEIYAQALRGRPGTDGFLDSVVDSWVDAAAEQSVRRGMPPDLARADARLGVAIFRGLLMDLLATGDHAAVDAALERYLDLYRAACQP